MKKIRSNGGCKNEGEKKLKEDKRKNFSELEKKNERKRKMKERKISMEERKFCERPMREIQVTYYFDCSIHPY